MIMVVMMAYAEIERTAKTSRCGIEHPFATFNMKTQQEEYEDDDGEETEV